MSLPTSYRPLRIWSPIEGLAALMTQSSTIVWGLILCVFASAYIVVNWRSERIAADYAYDIVWRLFHATQKDEDFRNTVSSKIFDEALVPNGDHRVGIDQAYQLCIPPNRNFQAVIVSR